MLTKNLNITRLHETMTKNGDIFDKRWNTFLIDVREDNNTKKLILTMKIMSGHFLFSTFYFCIIYDKRHLSTEGIFFEPLSVFSYL